MRLQRVRHDLVTNRGPQHRVTNQEQTLLPHARNWYRNQEPGTRLNFSAATLYVKPRLLWWWNPQGRKTSLVLQSTRLKTKPTQNITDIFADNTILDILTNGYRNKSTEECLKLYLKTCEYGAKIRNWFWRTEHWDKSVHYFPPMPQLLVSSPLLNRAGTPAPPKHTQEMLFLYLRCGANFSHLLLAVWP